MRVNSEYRTVILKLYPTEKQGKLLLKLEEDFYRFINLSRVRLQGLLYKELKNYVDLSPRTLTLLIQRFTGSVGGKAIIPFDGDNAKFVKECGMWFVEFQALKGRGNRVKILIARTDNEYYDVIEDLSKFPFVITREGREWFCYVSIPVEKNSNGLVVGIDFNMRKWVASPYTGKPVFFDVREYEYKIDRLQRLISRRQRKGEDTSDLYMKIHELVKHAHGNFLAKIRRSYGICRLAIEDIDTIYKLREKESAMINNWLYKKLAMRKFILRAMAKGHEVVEVNPRNTSRRCHKCGKEGIIYGKHKRLFKCPHCGLKDYNRDLNASRNIAYIASITGSM